MNIAMISSWHVHARGYANDFAAMPECQITAVWDEDEKAGKAWAAELGCPFVRITRRSFRIPLSMALS